MQIQLIHDRPMFSRNYDLAGQEIPYCRVKHNLVVHGPANVGVHLLV